MLKDKFKMKKMLVTAGTVFVSKFVAEYFARKNFIEYMNEEFAE